jgi:ATP-dependent helicase/nuclease subunit A
MRLTAAQTRAVEHRGSSMLVSASAGSGKTEVLARRAVSLIADPVQPCDVTQLLVVTFTRAAAAELRVRIALMLREAEAGVVGRQNREHLRRQMALIGLADIGTFDSWCQRIVREHFVAAGVDPNFGVLSEADSWVMQREVLDDLMEEVFGGDAEYSAAVQEWLMRTGEIAPDFLREMILGLNGFRGQLVNPESWFAVRIEECEGDIADWLERATRPLQAALGQELALQRDALYALLNMPGSEQPEFLNLYLLRLTEWQEQWADGAALLDLATEIESFAPRVKKPKDETLKKLSDDIRERWLKGRLQKRWSRTTLDEVLAQSQPALQRQRVLLQLETEFHRRLIAARHAVRRYRFEDIQRMTLDLLGAPAGHEQRQPTDLADSIRRRYLHILVDEYQDTSPAQVALMQLVTRSNPSNAFLVGDVKQSIYGFRRAEPRLFAQQAREFAAGERDGELLHLADNFRSHAGVLKPLNDLFAALFDPALGGTAFVEDERLVPAREAQEPDNALLDANPRIQVHVIEKPSRGKGSEHAMADSESDAAEDLEGIEREAALAAKEIRTLLEHSVQIPDRKSGQMRPLMLGDIAILVRSAKVKAMQIAGMLRDQGVPCVAIGRESIFEADIVQDLIVVLRLLRMRCDDISLAAYLRGPLVELCEPDLLALRQHCETGDFLTACEAYLESGPSGALRDQLTAALRQLDHWAQLATERDLPSLLHEVARSAALETFALAQPGGQSRVAMLHSFFDFAAEFAADEGRHLADFVAHIDDILAGQIDGPSVSASVVDAVAVMTIHASKGLEFPVVLLLGAGTRFWQSGGKSGLICDAEVGLGLKTYDDVLRCDVLTPAHHLLRTRLAEREVEEELRLLYVATTRARELLVIIGHTPAGRWEQHQGCWREQPLPLLTRMNVSMTIDWVLLALASAGADDSDSRWKVTTHAAERIPILKRQVSRDVLQNDPAAAAWTSDAIELLRQCEQLKFEAHPAVVSVSVLKQIATEDSDPVPGLYAVADELDWAKLSAPTNDQQTVISGTEFGSAVHRLMEVIDFAALAEPSRLEQAIVQAVADGVINQAAADVLPRESLLWLGTTELGQALAARSADVLRELPFIYLLPGSEQAPLVRGVVDAVLKLPEGLVVIDYKTDRFSDQLDNDQRLTGYRRQIQVYGQALDEILSRPVVRRVLVLIRPQICLDVDAGQGVDVAAVSSAVQQASFGYAAG